jgi:hypothetical protein
VAVQCRNVFNTEYAPCCPAGMQNVLNPAMDPLPF